MQLTGERWLMNAVGQPLSKEVFTLPAPASGEVVVEVAGCGVCHTDLAFLYDGIKTGHELPLCLGHEISGRVIATGPGTENLVNKAVVVPAVIPCGQCDLCERGLGNICREQKMPGNDIHGGFATHITVPAHDLCVVDEGLLQRSGLELSEIAVLADAVSTPYQAVSLAGIRPGDLAVVIGTGGVGGFAVQIAHATGAVVVAVDVVQERLDKLAAYGAALQLNPLEFTGHELKERIRDFAGQRGLRMTEWKIFECSGSAAGQSTAFSLLTYGAHVAIVGFTMEKINIRLSNLMAFNARLQGNWGCLPGLYPQALELILSGGIQMKPFVKLHPLTEINAIFNSAHAHQLAERAIMVP